MDRLSVSPAIGSRPDSLVSNGTSTSWSTESSSRPTSYGSDAMQATTPTSTETSSKDNCTQLPSLERLSSDSQDPAEGLRRPGHALMRLRRISMPTPSGLVRSDSTPSARQHFPGSQALLVPQNRFSVASARSCDSLPEEEGEVLQDGMPGIPNSAPEGRPSKILQSAIPLPTKRIRLKSTRRQSHSPSGIRAESTSREASTGSRPVSLALPTTSALVASSANGQAFVRESQTLRRSLTSNNGSSSTSPKNSPGKGKPSVTFSLAEPTRSIISARDFNTVKKNARMAKKDRIANEILQSERVYVAVLNEIQEHFIGPLNTPRSASKATSSTTSPADILPPRTAKEIFSNFGDIHKLNKEILRRLEESISAAPVAMLHATPSPAHASLRATSMALPGSSMGSIRAYQPTTLPVPRNIGTTLAPVLPFLKCYSLFVGNFGTAQTVLEREEKTNEAWKAYLATKKAERVGKGLSLTAMLLCIVQRIPRYRLLLGDLLRFTDPNDPDYKPLRQAVIAVEEVAEHLEVSIKQHESSVAMLDLQRSFIGLDFQLIAPGRRLLKSGVLVKQGRRADEERAFFLFTDILIYADIVYSWSLAGLSSSGGHAAAPSAASEKLPVSVIWPTRGIPAPGSEGSAQYTFRQCLDVEDLTVTSAAGQVFEIRSSINSFCLVAASPEAKHEWVAALREAKEELLQSRRTLLTEEEEKKRSRLRRLSMPVPPPLAERSLSNTSAYSIGGLAPQSALSSALPSPTGSVFSNDWDLPDRFNEELALNGSEWQPSSEHLPEHTKHPSSLRSSYSPQTKYQNLKVYEDYSAPIWVPDNRTAKCMRCGEMFALWRRRHHCRLCGDVVCWACSTKSFAIPSADGKGSHIIGRACDECYHTCFTHTPDAERADPLGGPLRPSESSYSLLENLNPLRPLMTRAVSLYEMASGNTRSREGSLEVETPDRSRRSSQIGASGGESVNLLKSVLGQ